MFTSNFRKALFSGSESSKIKTFVSSAIAGTDSVDFVIAGDSNTNYGGWGWTDGLAFSLRAAGANDYATPLLPVFSRESATFYGLDSQFDAYGKILEDESVANAGGLGALGGTLQKGTSANTPELFALMSRTSGTLRPNASPFNYGYIASGNWADWIGGINAYRSTTYLAWVGDALKYRVVHAKGPSFGTIRLQFRKDGYGGDAKIGTATSVACADTSYSWTTSEHSLAADSSRTGKGHKSCYADDTGGSGWLTGPVALALHSISRDVKGICCTSMDHYGGANTKQCSDNTVGAPLIVNAYLKEIRTRQTDRGGTGRVIVMFQGGVNGTGASTFAADATAFFQACATQWSALGFPASDLGFLGLTSHQNNSPDTLTTIRASASSIASQYCIVNGDTLASYATLLTGSGGNTYFKNATTERQHLTEDGYKYVTAQLVTALTA
jgi:hypothetical protein